MEKITFSFCDAARAHAVNKAIRYAGFKTIPTNDRMGIYINVMTSESNRIAVEEIRQSALAALIVE